MTNRFGKTPPLTTVNSDLFLMAAVMKMLKTMVMMMKTTLILTTMTVKEKKKKKRRILEENNDNDRLWKQVVTTAITFLLLSDCLTVLRSPVEFCCSRVSTSTKLTPRWRFARLVTCLPRRRFPISPVTLDWAWHIKNQVSLRSLITVKTPLEMLLMPSS